MQYYIKLAALIVIAFSLGVLGNAIGRALAHEAPSGWSYPSSCCSGKDCQEVPTTSVRETPSGYVITLTKHKMLLPGYTATYNIPYNDARIKDSPDGVYHVCIGQQTLNAGQVYGARLICLFAPPKGF